MIRSAEKDHAASLEILEIEKKLEAIRGVVPERRKFAEDEVEFTRKHLESVYDRAKKDCT